MVKRVLALLFVLILAISFSTVTFTQEKMQKEEQKMEMKKEEKATGSLKSISCDPVCGFMCRSHDEKELMSVVKTHAKKVHKMSLNGKQMKEMMKTEESSGMKK